MDDRGPPALTNPMDREVEHGISLMLSVDQPELTVGDGIRFRLAFRNDSDETNFVVPPIDGSWDDMEQQPAYNLEFSDSDGNPVLHSLGYRTELRCGMMDEYRLDDRRIIGPHTTFELEDADTWSPRFRVLKHARPGLVWLRVRYRADQLPGVEPIEIVSNPVKLLIRGSDEDLWACSNALVEKAQIYDFAENEPVKLITRGDGYFLVYRHFAAHVQSKKAAVTHTLFIQELDHGGQPLGDAIEIAQYENNSRWSGEVKVVSVSGGLLVAFAAIQGRERGEIRLVHVDTSAGKPRPGKMQSIAATSGTPLAIALARSGEHVGIVWQDVGNNELLVWFRTLTINGEPDGISRLMRTSGRVIPGQLLFEPIPNAFALIWHEYDVGLRFQRIGTDGALLGDPTSGPFETSTTAFALGTSGNRMRLAYFGKDKMEEVELSADDFSRILKLTVNSIRPGYGVAVWMDNYLVRMVTDYNKLMLDTESSGAGQPLVLSETFGWKYDIDVSPDGGKLLVTWSDYRDDDLPRCREMKTCVKEAYIAVFDAKKKVLVPSRRITRTSIKKPVPIDEVDFASNCGDYFNSPLGRGRSN